MLYIVATPIGNLSDITFRAIKTLQKADLILCEDTRITRKLLAKFNINTPLLSYHQGSGESKIKKIVEEAKRGKNIALVCDGGTPGISDPGGKLIERILQNVPDVKISPIPGPCAMAAAASVSGFPMDKFLFLGFPPSKKKRKKFFEQALESRYPVVFYESPHRIIKTLSELQLLIISHKLLVNIVVCRELTKKFEIIYRGTIEEVLKELSKDKIKGEFVVIAERK